MNGGMRGKRKSTRECAFCKSAEEKPNALTIASRYAPSSVTPCTEWPNSRRATMS